MQRQSLGSNGGGAGAAAKDDTHSRDYDYDYDHDDRGSRKSTNKSRRFSSPAAASWSMLLAPSSSSSPKPSEKLIHLIPLLTLLCFLVLYLVSHTPSQSDLAGFKLSSKHGEAISELDDVDPFSTAELRRGADVLAVRSFRNLQEIADDTSSAASSSSSSRKSRSYRKFAHF